MNEKLKARPDKDGHFYEDFVVYGDQFILRRRLGRKGQERIRDLGGRVERYETDGFGNMTERQKTIWDAEAEAYRADQDAKKKR